MSCRPVQESYGQPGPQGRSTDAIVFGLRLGAKALPLPLLPLPLLPLPLLPALPLPLLRLGAKALLLPLLRDCVWATSTTTTTTTTATDTTAKPNTQPSWLQQYYLACTISQLLHSLLTFIPRFVPWL